MNFEKELEGMLRRYIPNNTDQDHYESIIKILSIKIQELHEKHQEVNSDD